MMWRLPSRFPVRPRAPRISAQTVGLTGGPCSHVGPRGLLATVPSVGGPRWVGAPRGGRTPEGGPAPFYLGRAGRREQAEVGPMPVVALRSLEAASLRLPGGPGGRLGESNGARGVLSPALPWGLVRQLWRIREATASGPQTLLPWRAGKGALRRKGPRGGPGGSRRPARLTSGLRGRCGAGGR